MFYYFSVEDTETGHRESMVERKGTQSKVPLEFVTDLKESMMHHDSTLCVLVSSVLLSVFFSNIKNAVQKA